MSENRKVILILWDNSEHLTPIGIASTQEKAWELVGKSVEQNPHAMCSGIQFREVVIDEDFVAYFNGPVGKWLNKSP